jgi:hypothetical protein
MRRQTVALLGLSVVLVVALYFLFSLFLENTTIPYAYEIAAAFMGALVTVVITMVLLNRQSEVETLKELERRAAQAEDRRLRWAHGPAGGHHAEWRGLAGG